MSAPVLAQSSQLGSDLYWKLWAGEDKFIRWIGYGDHFWWNNVAPSDKFRRKVGPATGRVFILNPETNAVEIMAGEQ